HFAAHELRRQRDCGQLLRDRRSAPDRLGKQAADEGPDSMTALHTLPVSAQANAYEVRVTPKPESPIDAREDGMSRFSELRLQIPAQANAHQVRVTPEPKPTRDSRSDGMAAPHASPVSAQPAVIPAQAGIQAT